MNKMVSINHALQKHYKESEIFNFSNYTISFILFANEFQIAFHLQNKEICLQKIISFLLAWIK